ncbi:macrophage mannose receptor 1-like [Betta splendens]|uniref:Macrophage mannose receptor 1-like n=1 Tax=Betta splendens TaxID=158456 RepID=A0A8M1HM58_BETSP|nr:macrophage mannose receptor 1-like [Betta splendens]
MDYRLIIFVLTGALISDASVQTRQFYFVNTPLNWTDARSFCRQFYSDLATIENTADVSAVTNTTSNYTGKAWIGLLNIWIWSLNDTSLYGEGGTGFLNWGPGYPVYGQQSCVLVFGIQTSAPGIWTNWYCTHALPFVCYNGAINGVSSFVLVNDFMTWTDAQSYCRNNYVDLASIRNEAENSIITNLAGVYGVFIGLHQDVVWSDGSTSVFRNWASGEPYMYSSIDECITTSFSDSGLWSNDNCSLSSPFICYTTAPSNAQSFGATAQNETSITLQWSQVNSGVSFILQFNGTVKTIAAPVGGGPVTQTVSSLTAGTEYTFTLFSVFDNVRSSGVTIIAATDQYDYF